MRLNFNSIESLQKSIEIPNLTNRKPNVILKSMQTLYQTAMEKYKENNLEETYILLYKYMVLFQHVQANKDKQYSASINEQKIEIRDAVVLLEKLSDELSKVYIEIGKCDDTTSPKLSPKEDSPNITSCEMKRPSLKKIKDLLWVEIEDLQETIKFNDNFKYIILDTRPESDYQSSHLLQFENINMPVDKFTGISADKLNSCLNEKSRMKWSDRKNYDLIVILGENDSPNLYSKSVETMHSIITKWDPNTNYKSEPVILDGGYCRFRFIFPMFCSSVSISPSAFMKMESEDVIDIEEIEYPLLEEELNSSHSQIEYPDLEIPVNENRIRVESQELPIFDRSLKPGPNKTINHLVNDVTILDIKHNTDFEKQISIKPKQIIMKSENTPDVNRNTKPQPRLLDHLEPIYGNSIAGITGLSNYSNNCYINAVCQVLTHIPDITYFFLSNQHIKLINKNTVRKGRITVAFADLCEGIWSEHFLTISCRDLKKAVGQLNSRFSESSQEDAHEFLLYFINYLHEEIAVVGPKVVKTKPEKSWYTCTRGQQSPIYDLFYGQIMSSIQCSTCNSISSQYTIFGGLTLEITSRTKSITDCIMYHFESEYIDDYTCENCNNKTHIEKKTAIEKLPTVLLIHLKRFRTLSGEYSKIRTHIDFQSSIVIEDTYEESSKYCLIGLITHTGTLNGGHYKAYIQHKQSWFVCDDSVVTPVDDLYKTRNIKRDVYLLFYRKM